MSDVTMTSSNLATIRHALSHMVAFCQEHGRTCANGPDAFQFMQYSWNREAATFSAVLDKLSPGKEIKTITIKENS